MALVELTPGPNMGYLTIVASRWGRPAGLMTVAGVTLGLTVYMLAAVAGLGAIVTRVAWLYALLQWAGVGFLLWLAFEAWRGGPAPRPGHQAEPPARGRLFARGLIANLLNPKAAVFYVALLPGFTNPARGDPATQALALGAIHVVVSIMIHTAIVLAAGSVSLARWETPNLRRRLDQGVAVGLALIALWLGWETFQST